MNWYLEVLKKYATFSGRARRKEYWMFTLVHVLIALVLMASSGLIGPVGALLYMLYILGTIVPSIAVTVRRLQDQDKEWPWIFVSFIFSFSTFFSVWTIICCNDWNCSDL